MGRAVIHINGRDYDARDGSLINDSKKKATHQSIDGVVSHTKPARQHAPAHIARPVKKATTLMRSAVKKPRIFSDIRHTPIISAVKIKPAALQPHVANIKKSSVISHFSPIEPRTVAMTPAPEPVHSERIEKPPVSRGEAHIKRQLDKATAHLEKKPRAGIRGKVHAMTPRKRKGASLAAGLAALLLIGGFIVYQSIPELSFAVASRRAGFGASLPKYTPGGFAIDGPVAYSPGRIIVSFSSHTDDRRYNIEQAPSTLTTDALQDQVATDSGDQYQTYNQGGLTIFLSEDSATWVDRGILYTLKGEADLSGAQIASIASSM